MRFTPSPLFTATEHVPVNRGEYLYFFNYAPTVAIPVLWDGVAFQCVEHVKYGPFLLFPNYITIAHGDKWQGCVPA